MRRKYISNKEIPITLFSFLDILGGTIGILTLMIAIFMIQMSINNEVVNITPVPGTLEDKKYLSYIICNGNGQVVINHNQITNQTNINSKLIDDLLIELEDREKHLIIAVRPDGFEDFRNLRDRIETLNISVGYQPIDKDWEIKFSKK